MATKSGSNSNLTGDRWYQIDLNIWISTEGQKKKKIMPLKKVEEPPVEEPPSDNQWLIIINAFNPYYNILCNMNDSYYGSKNMYVPKNDTWFAFSEFWITSN